MSKKNKIVQELMSELAEKIYNSKPVRYYNFSLLPNIQSYPEYNNMMPHEKNNFQHIAGAAQSANEIGLPWSILGGMGKEVHDKIYGDSWNDVKTDWKNNKQGWKIHKQYPNLQDTQLHDYVFNNHIKPYRQ